MKLNYCFIIFIVFIAACNSNRNTIPNQVVAQVAGNSLSLIEIQQKFKSRNPEQLDSLTFFKNYTESWIKQQLLVTMAEKKLSPAELDIKDELEDYRQELIIHKLKEKKNKEFTETSISENEVLLYYNQNKIKFLLDFPIIKVSYIIFPKEVVLPANFKYQIVTKTKSDIKTSEDFIFKFAKKYDNFNNNWIYLDNLAQQVKVDKERLTNRKGLLEIEVDGELHVIAINDYIKQGEQAPFEFVAPQIKSMILNKKKIEFLREIKDSLYQDALKYNKFSVFNK